MKLICDELNVAFDDVLDFDLSLADAVPAVCLLLFTHLIDLIFIYLFVNFCRL